MRRFLLVLASALAITGLSIVPASAAQPQWDMTGTYTIHYLCTSGCAGEYDHSDSITVQSFGDPETFSGTGTYVINGVPQAGYAENVLNGTLTGSTLHFDVDYTGTNPTYYMEVDGAVATDGSLSGTAVSNAGHYFNWTATGKARPFGYTASGDCGAGAFVSSTGGVTTIPTIAGHNYEVTASGTYYAGGIGLYDIRADAEFSQDRAQFASGAGWTALVHNNESTDTGLLDLWVNAASVNWGSYNADHIYTAEFVAADSTTSFALNIYDSYPINNTGGLCVSLTDLHNVGTFSGLFEPVTMDFTNVAKAGRVIPIKWRVLDYNGNPVSDLTLADVRVSTVPGGGVCGGDPADAVEQYVASSGLQYLGDGYWQFNWKTPTSYAGQCKAMTLSLFGVAEASANFQFRA